eukprot:12293544-Alexandrium_andersonii.AAC.1
MVRRKLVPPPQSPDRHSCGTTSGLQDLADSEDTWRGRSAADNLTSGRWLLHPEAAGRLLPLGPQRSFAETRGS